MGNRGRFLNAWFWRELPTPQCPRYPQNRGLAQPCCFMRRAGLWPPSNRRTREGRQAGRSTSELHRYKYTLGPCDLPINRRTVLRWCHSTLSCIYSFVHCSLGLVCFFFFFLHIRGNMCLPHTHSLWTREDKLTCHFCFSSGTLHRWFPGTC